MSEQYKYEPIFGDQTLFDSAPEDAVSVRYGKSEYIFDSEEIKATTGQLRDVPVVAMRRIIKVPKRWTWEDKKAGRLPDVGWYVYSEKDSESAVVIAKDHEGDIWFQCSCGVVRCTDGYVMLPIETPAEKAQRLREEWCRKCTSQFYPRGSNGFPEMIYDALLSGELPMPTKGDE